MAVEVEIDIQVLKSEIKKRYASVSREPEKDFIFPTGRPWAEDLADPTELANVPDSAIGSFAGVANPCGDRSDPGQGRRLRGDLPRAHTRGRIQIADVTIQNPVSAEGRRNVDLFWTG
jgi:hypothetical protein